MNTHYENAPEALLLALSTNPFSHTSRSHLFFVLLSQIQGREICNTANLNAFNCRSVFQKNTPVAEREEKDLHGTSENRAQNLDVVAVVTFCRPLEGRPVESVFLSHLCMNERVISLPTLEHRSRH